MGKILFVTPYYEPNIVGGAEVSTQLIAEGIKPYSVVLTMDKSGYITQRNGVEIIALSNQIRSKIWEKVLHNQRINTYEKIYQTLSTMIPNPLLVYKYKKLLRNNRITKIVINSNVDTLCRASIWKAAYKSGIETVLVLRDPILAKKSLFGVDISKTYRKIIIKQLKWISKIAAPSQYMINYYKGFGLSKEESTVIPNAVDITFKLSEYDNKSNTIIYAGSIREEKGIIDLVKAVELLNQTKSVTLEIYGSGILAEECKKSKYVTVNDWIPRNEMLAKMERAKAVVLPSKYPEAFGRIIIESVAVGTLAIGSDSGGIPEIFGKHLEYQYKTGNISELAQRIDRIISMPRNVYTNEILCLQKEFRKYDYSTYIQNWSKYLFANTTSE